MRQILAVVALSGTLLFAAHAQAGDRTVTLAVQNMYCTACPFIVKQSLAKVDGVEQVVVSFEAKTATVTYDDQKTTVEALTSATSGAGYPSRPMP